ncbi:MAG TPA: hypothetical protein VF796_16575 [Humisphaera sp.]
MRSHVRRQASKIGLALALVALGLAGACDGPPAGSPPQGPAPAAAAAIRRVEDRSLAADEYVALGVPSYDRGWLADDMSRAASVLAAQNPATLPRYGSARSGAVFDRIVSADNLRPLRDRSIAINLRLPQAATLQQSLNQLTKTYLAAYAAGGVGGDELVELSGAVLRSSREVFELAEEFMGTLSPTDPKYAARMHGLETVRQGMAQIVSGTLTTLGEAAVYSVEARVRLVGYCRETLPYMVAHLSPPSKAEVLSRLDRMVADPGMQALRPHTDRLRDEVRSGQPPPPAV